MARKSKKASEVSMEMLHNLVTNDLTDRISGDHSTADIRAAIEWLKANHITGVAAENTPLNRLTELLSDLEFEDVEMGIK